MSDKEDYSSLETLFQSTAFKFAQDQLLTGKYWRLIVIQYRSPRRYYHTFDHLQYMLDVLSDVKQHIDDWDAIVFALFFHDYSYSTTRKDNEHMSAVYAADALRAFGLPPARIDRVLRHIIATSGHEASTDHDTDFFTDADLSILAAEPPTYQQYAANIRREYWLYPDEVYNAGRKRVLNHFLAMAKIFKTDHFKKLEEQARMNLGNELSLLTN